MMKDDVILEIMGQNGNVRGCFESVRGIGAM